MTFPRLNDLTDLADLLRNLPSEMGFDMKFTYSPHCGSPCCIAGWVHACNPETQGMPLAIAVASLAHSRIPVQEFDLLCYPTDDDEDLNQAWKATPEQAARAVEILRDTGKCNWDLAMGDRA